MRSVDPRVEGPLDVAALRRRRQEGVVSVLALGTFDGVHLGHRAILQEAIRRKELLRAARPDADVEAVAFTFDVLPLEVLRPEQAPPRLMTAQERCRHILACGIDRVVVARFDGAFARQSPEEFVEETLFAAFHVGAVVVGFNHTFGYQGRGDVALLTELAGRRGVEVGVVAGVRVGDTLVSSTTIRKLLAAGRCAEACRLLGRPYYLDGRVVGGQRQGRRLGFPTANLAPEPGLLVPGEGVYLTRAESAGEHLGDALTVVSRRPTFDGQERSVETFILGFSGDLYGQPLRVHFLEYLRPIIRFAGPQELKAQIEADVAEARRRLGARNVPQSFT